MSTKLGAEFTISATDKTQAAFNSVKGSLNNLKQTVSNIGNLAGLGGMLGIGAGIGLISTAIGSLIKINNDAKESMAGLSQAVQNSGESYYMSAQKIQAYDEQLSQQTGYSTTDFEKLQTILLSYGALSQQALQDATNAAADWASATGHSIERVAKQIGTLTSNPITGIGTLATQFGVHLTAAQEASVIGFMRVGDSAAAAGVELKALEDHLHGLAQAKEEASPTNAFVEAWNKFLNVFQDTETPLQKAKDQLASLQEQEIQYESRFGQNPALLNQIKATQTYIDKLQQQQAAEQATNKPDTANDSVKAAKILQEGKALDALTAKLKQQAATYGMGADAVLKYRMTVGDLSDVLKSETQAQRTADETTLLAAQHQIDVEQAAKKYAESVKRATTSVNNQIETLQKQTATFGENKVQVMAYSIAHGKLAEQLKLMGAAGKKAAAELLQLAAAEQTDEDKTKAATKAHQAQQKALAAQKQTLQEAKKLIEGLNPTLKLADSVASMQKLVGVTVDGVKITEEMVQKYALLEQEGKKATTQLNQFGVQAARSTEQAFAKFFMHTNEGLKGMVEGFAKAMEQILANILAKKLATVLFGSLASGGNAPSGSSNSSGLMGVALTAMSSYFGGAHAAGGTAPGGKISLVGEAGPELFMPHSSGTIISNNQLKGIGGTTNHNINIDARGAGPDETAKLLSMRQSILAEMRGQTEYRLNRNGWMHQ